MRKLATLLGAAAVVGLMALASPALAQTTVTSFAPFTNTPTPGVWFESDVRPGGTASIADLFGVGGNLENSQPIPDGAALLTTDLTNDAKAEVGVVNSYGIPDSIFSTLSITYDYHKVTNTGQNLAAAPSLKLTFFNAVCDDAASQTPPLWKSRLLRHARIRADMEWADFHISRPSQHGPCDGRMDGGDNR